MTDAATDRQVLRDQYSDAERLAARQAVWQFNTGPALLDAVMDLARLSGSETVVDVGCGNGRYLAELRRRGHCGPVIGLDLSAGMARESRGYAFTAVADAEHLPLRTGGVDVALCLHMLYHVPDIPRAAAELRRVTRPGGTLVVCEFSTPTWRPFRALYRDYLVAALPRIASAVSSNPAAYEYLAESILAWPDQAALAAVIEAAGWQRVEWRNLSGGIVALHRARA